MNRDNDSKPSQHTANDPVIEIEAWVADITADKNKTLWLAFLCDASWDSIVIDATVLMQTEELNDLDETVPCSGTTNYLAQQVKWTTSIKQCVDESSVSIWAELRPWSLKLKNSEYRRTILNKYEWSFQQAPTLQTLFLTGMLTQFFFLKGS